MPRVAQSGQLTFVGCPQWRVSGSRRGKLTTTGDQDGDRIGKRLVSLRSNGFRRPSDKHAWGKGVDGNSVSQAGPGQNIALTRSEGCLDGGRMNGGLLRAEQ